MSEKICKIEGCDNKSHSKGLCSKHYNRLIRYGSPEAKAPKVPRHGMSKSDEYRVWKAMNGRCYYEKSALYHRYGGRGITVCDRWRNSFMAFYEDMGPKPFPKAQIDRIDNDGNYEPGNCRWVSHEVNAQNDSRTKLTENDVVAIRHLFGEYSSSGLSKMFGVTKTNILSIVNKETWRNVE